MSGRRIVQWVGALTLLFGVLALFVKLAAEDDRGADLGERCSDGWASPSIGSPGACSHHGGVGGSAYADP